jgi:trk system potassium uptake protein TrkH
MPFSNILKPVGYLDNLFVSVSAVCVTGLTTVNVSAQYNLFGKFIVMILMQMGGLGPMTIIAIILQRNSQRMGMTEKKVFAAGAGKSDLYNVPQYIRRIFRYTLLFEGIGFITILSVISLSFVLIVCDCAAGVTLYEPV